MSGGKKKREKKRTYSESEVRRAIRKTADDSVAKVLLLCVTAATDEFDLDEEGTVRFLNRMKRYINSEDKGLVSTDTASESILHKTGIDLRLSKW